MLEFPVCLLWLVPRNRRIQERYLHSLVFSSPLAGTPYKTGIYFMFEYRWNMDLHDFNMSQIYMKQIIIWQKQRMHTITSFVFSVFSCQFKRAQNHIFSYNSICLKGTSVVHWHIRQNHFIANNLILNQKVVTFSANVKR